MGFRFRKSINLGGGFRVNLSKSGVGYSLGTKGARITKTAKGTKRTTLSIPGTGISYVSETSGKKKAASHSSKTQQSALRQSTNHSHNSPNNQDNNERKDTVVKKSGKISKDFVLWALTVFFILTFLLYIPHVASFLAFSVALFLTPIQKWQRLLSKFIKGKIKTLVIIVLIILTIETIPTTEITDIDIPPEATMAVLDETTEAAEETTIMNEETTEHTTEPATEPTAEPATTPTTELATVPTTSLSPEPIETKGSTVESTTEATEVVYQGLTIISWPETISRNETGTVKIQGKPNTKYTITVYYKSGASTADGLEAKTTDSNGYVSWSWKVGGRTSAGTFKIVISGSGESKTVYFTVED